ncbi:DNA-3-methyladenine glycosylase [Nocardioides luteus]|uniref:Putative 3-methyladenine DNA glycosylase n=1 Tax=Nocardioides luteus TaxID=1844 RepID=A0ABQ5T3N8_9ACTN|nr:DNA-3-methyladenine glycosylase [Nocardioides luteus]MDR7310439.1 DNA-3-methyladenine glycosylase [Nocardioides luteus]GGR52712.1 putative 3-methyladenine DNA glycosylase [Nocardioides luteus]GLJ69781.1 putative 3-methyladenine DNA glycosylase [Nocardioides luteus]
MLLTDLLHQRPEVTAPRILGARLSFGGVTVRLTELEAYAADDPGSHAFRGKTNRNRVMFGPPGHLYVYFTYGMHHCANLVCHPEGEPGGILLRAGEVVDGIELARERRGSARDVDLARGPARLASALGIDLGMNGTDAFELDLAPVGEWSQIEVATGPRVGLRLAPDQPWRFWVAGDPTVSQYRPAKKLRANG